jgi:hypothetical protein
VTRDTAGNTGGGRARGSRRPAAPRRPNAAARDERADRRERDAGDERWSSGLTGPQRAFPVWGGAPGFEFEGGRAARTADPFSPGLFDAGHFGEPPGPAADPADGHHGAGTEWGRLRRSFLPEPVKRNWFAEFRAALHFRGAGVRVIIPIVAMMVFGVAVAVIAGANGNHDGPAPPPAALGFPPASLAGNAFAAAATGRGINQMLGRVTSDGAEIVAVGSQQGARIARAQFFVSADDGRTWFMGHVQAPGGGPPPPGYAARFVAGGRGAWVALGPSSIWTSPDGRTWTLASTRSLPLQPGDRISVLKRTANGFIAVGSNAPADAASDPTPVVFLSQNGTTWRRLGPSQLHLTTGTGATAGQGTAAGAVLGLKSAAVDGRQILISGDVSAVQAVGHPRRSVTIQAGAAWLSSDGGTTWTLVIPPGAPAGHGAQAQISGLAATADGFVALRPATVNRRAGVDVYRSPNGTSWAFTAALTAPQGFVSDLVNDGAVITGQAGPALVAFTSADGTTWRQAPAFGTAATQSLSGVAVGQGGTVVTAGTTANDPDSRQPLLTVLGGAAGTPRPVDIARIPGAADQELAVNDVAAGNGLQVAVGSANGYPAAWTSANGGSTWTRANGQTPAALTRPGVQQLTSVAYGADGWLAVGGVLAVAAPHPVVVVSGNASAWTAVDSEPAFGEPGLVTQAAAAGPDGYVIVGDQSVAGRTVAAAWWSAALTGWQRATVGSPAGAQSVASRQMRAVTAGPGGFVAVGQAGHAAAAWTSPDGRTWTQQNVPLPYGATRAVLQQVASDGHTVVAVGAALTDGGEQLPFAASSADGGRTWAEAALPVPRGRATVTALTAAGGEFLATGTYGSTPGHQDVVVWTSASGTAAAWHPATPAGQGLTGTGIQAITGLDVAASTVTGVGFTATPGGEQPVFWQFPVR